MTATVCVPLAVERLALRGALPGCRVLAIGMGPRRAAAAARAAGLSAAMGTAAGGVLLAGVAGGLDPGLRPGDLVVATEIRAVEIRALKFGAAQVGAVEGAVTPVPSAPQLAGAIRRLGLPVHLGPVASTPTLTTGAARARLAATGALAVEMEAAALAAALGLAEAGAAEAGAAEIGAAEVGAAAPTPDPAAALAPEPTLGLAAAPGQVPFAVVRAVVDTADHPLLRPGTPARALRALANLRRAAPAIQQWAAAVGAAGADGEFTLPREVD
jgi:4-hydroxy-3-methylbut-2-enyl diphosphate reductase